MPTKRVNNSGATNRRSELGISAAKAHIERPGGDGDDDRPGQRREEIGRDPGGERDQRERDDDSHGLAGAGVDRKRRPAVAGSSVRVRLRVVSACREIERGGNEPWFRRLLLGGDAAKLRRADGVEAFGEALAVGIDQRRGARGGDRIGGLPQRDLSGQRRADHVRLDQAVVAGAALVGVAIALDQARAFGDFERELGGLRAPPRTIRPSQRSIARCSSA